MDVSFVILLRIYNIFQSIKLDPLFQLVPIYTNETGPSRNSRKSKLETDVLSPRAESH